MVLPLLTVVIQAFSFHGSFSAFWFDQIFSDPYFFPLKIRSTPSFPFFIIDLYVAGKAFYWVGNTLYLQGFDLGVILNSLYVALAVTVISTILGTTLAFMMARYKFYGKTFFRTILLIPLVSSPFVGAIGIQRMIRDNGLINKLLYDTLHVLPFKIALDGFVAVILIQVLSFYSVVYLNAYAAFVNIDPSLEEQAENLGSKGFHLFRTVTFPLALPGIEAGAILTFILSIEDIGTPLVFQTSQASKTLALQTFIRIFAPTGTIVEIAPALSLILLSIAILSFFLIRRYVALRKYAMISRGGAWHPRINPVGKVKGLLVYVFIIGVIMVALTPHVGVLLLSLADYWGDTILPRFTLSNFGILFTDPDIARSILNSFAYSFAATIMIIIMATGAAYVINRKKIPGMGLLDMLVTMPVAIPGIVLGIGYFTLFLKTPLSPIINPVPLLTLSYMIRKFPFTVRSAYAGLQQTPQELEYASLNIGAGRLTTFTRITLPLIASNVLAGAMLSFVYSMSEVSMGLILGSVNPAYAPMTWKIRDVLSQVGAGPFYAAALGIFLMVTQIIVITIAVKLLGQRTTAMTGI